MLKFYSEIYCISEIWIIAYCRNAYVIPIYKLRAYSNLLRIEIMHACSYCYEPLYKFNAVHFLYSIILNCFNNRYYCRLNFRYFVLVDFGVYLESADCVITKI